MTWTDEKTCLNSLHSRLLKGITVTHSRILVSSLWRVLLITLSSQADIPSLTDVIFDKECAFISSKTVHTKSSSSSSPSFLDITAALSDYLSFPLSFTHHSPFSQSVSPFKDSLTIRTSKHNTPHFFKQTQSQFKTTTKKSPSSVSNVVGFHWVPDMSCFFWQREVHLAISQQATVGKGLKQIPLLSSYAGNHGEGEASLPKNKKWKWLTPESLQPAKFSALKSYERMIFAFALFSWTFQDSMMIPAVFAMKSIWTACPRCSTSIEITFSISSWQCCRVNSRQTRFRRQCTTCPMWHWASSSTVVRQHTTPTTRSQSTAFRSGCAEETGSQPQLLRFDWWCITSSRYSPW